ncbi:AraC family transcriptional regulator N-terminal domain-containing protein [Caulobacter sp. S45]|uniref:AraC family transcriptional regulator N-terminal domain-containing protein n=1 Tax=Caulobacter sp. S45 TaxID=1641861 RepID=UPI001575A9C2
MSAAESEATLSGTRGKCPLWSEGLSFAGRTHAFATGTCAVATVGLPFVSQVIEASPARPCVGTKLRLDPGVIADLLLTMRDAAPCTMSARLQLPGVLCVPLAGHASLLVRGSAGAYGRCALPCFAKPCKAGKLQNKRAALQPSLRFGHAAGYSAIETENWVEDV